MSQTISKVCVVCGQNVANKPRTKDQAGRYYCNPCWHAAATKSSEAIGSAAAPLGAKQAFYDLADETPVANPDAGSTYKCSRCRETFEAYDVYDNNGTIICKHCFESTQSVPAVDSLDALAASVRSPAPSKRKSPPTGSPKSSVGSVVGAIVCGLIAILILAGVIAASQSSPPRNMRVPICIAFSAVALVFAVSAFAFWKRRWFWPRLIAGPVAIALAFLALNAIEGQRRADEMGEIKPPVYLSGDDVYADVLGGESALNKFAAVIEFWGDLRNKYAIDASAFDKDAYHKLMDEDKQRFDRAVEQEEARVKAKLIALGWTPQAADKHIRISKAGALNRIDMRLQKAIDAE